MKRFSFISLMILSLFGWGQALAEGWGQTPPEAARREMIRGVGMIDTEGRPGGFICTSADAFGVIAGKNADGTVLPVVAAAFVEKGRVVAFGHPGFVTTLPARADTERFIANTLSWLTNGHRVVSITAYRSEDFAKGLRATGLKVESTSDLSLALRSAVIAAPASAFAAEDYGKIREFVANGGGLLTCGVGWEWKKAAEAASDPSSLALDCDEQKFFASFGLVMSDLAVQRTSAPGVRGVETDFGTLLSEGGFQVYYGFPLGTTLPEALMVVAKNSKGIPDGMLRRQVSKTLTTAADVYPPDKSAAYKAFRAFVRRPDAKKTPSPETPLTSADLAARVRTVLKKNAWLSNPVQKWGADAGAAACPGLVKKGAKPEEACTVVVSTSEKRRHSTGLFANAGEPITVTAPAKAVGLGVKIRVGADDEDVTSGQEPWRRAPVVSVTIPLTKTETTFASPFGGLVYVVVPDGAPAGQTLKLTIDGAYRAPHFRRGRDTNATWRQTVASAVTPQAELEGDRMVVTLPAKALAAIDDPEQVVKFWDDANDICQKLAGLRTPFAYKLRLCADSLAEDGRWEALRALGRSYQDAAWTLDVAPEATDGIFALCCQEKLLGVRPRDALAEHNVQFLVDSWKAAGKNFAFWAKEPFLALETFVRLREVYGWELFERLFADYRRPGAPLPKTDQEKLDQWALRLTKLYNANFADYFVAWGWPISQSVRTVCKRYSALRDRRLFP